MTDRAGGGRLTSLDGLRGVAALVVMFQHVFLALPRIADLAVPPVVGSVTWWFESTPLKLLTAGSEGVLIFFVLSGLVVALPALRQPKFDWLAYYPRRLVRLALPVLAAVLFGSILILSHRQVLGAHVSSWIATFSFADPTGKLFVGSFDLFLFENLVDNPLWTIRLEVLFSLALPVFVMAALALKRHVAISLGVCVALVFLGIAYGNISLQFFPVFFAGTLLAVHLDAVAGWAARIRPTPWTNLAWLALLLGGLMLLILSWLLWSITASTLQVHQLTSSAEFLGAIIVVGVAFLWRPAIAFLTIPPLRWLGRVSFSLYLVHVPILIFYANLFGPGRWLWIVVCTMPTALVVAELFGRFVEQPAHRLSKRVGASAAARLRASVPAA